MSGNELRAGEGSGTRARLRVPAWIVRWKNRQSQFSIMSSMLPALLLVVFVTDLLFRHSTMLADLTFAWLALYTLMALLPLLLGRRFPRWAGLVMVLTTELWSGYLFAVAGHVHAEINVLLQLPTIALYLGWFFPWMPAVACMLVGMARLGLTLTTDRDFGQGDTPTVILVGYAALITVFCFFGARVVQAQSEKQLSTDPLTEVYNRRGLMVKGATLLNRVRRRHWECAVAVVDLDDFKSINDAGGHAAGDALLLTEAQRLRSLLGAGSGGRGRDGLVGRFGGDEFVMLRRGSLESLSRDLQELRQSGAAAWSWGAVQLATGEPLTAVIARADAELYLAKRELCEQRKSRARKNAQVEQGLGEEPAD
ncbi:GGDEF domain-containing protein [Leucobacter salsicius]|uniref:GGDEF domain-containing protein n=1 Tax=Leucobacter salsicius TaxID=664638 RepID=UPI000348A65A|nr:GGDEF domain-containing protein [Leucobacter salsicius]